MIHRPGGFLLPSYPVCRSLGLDFFICQGFCLGTGQVRMKAGVGARAHAGRGGASVSGGTRSTEVRVAVRKVGAPRKITTEKYLTEKSRKNKGDGVSLGSEEETGVFVL